MKLYPCIFSCHLPSSQSHDKLHISTNQEDSLQVSDFFCLVVRLWVFSGYPFLRFPCCERCCEGIVSSSDWVYVSSSLSTEVPNSSLYPDSGVLMASSTQITKQCFCHSNALVYLVGEVSLAFLPQPSSFTEKTGFCVPPRA